MKPTPTHLAPFIISKKEKGYRYSIDPFLVSDFTEVEGSRSVADLGTGNGIIPVLLARKSQKIDIAGLEIQRDLAENAQKNIKQNSLSDRINIICCDINNTGNLFAQGAFDIVVGNPPYRRSNDGKINPDSEKAIARHEMKITLSEYIKASKHLVKERGRVTIIYHPYRLTELLHVMAKERIAPIRMRFVHSSKGSLARMVMVEGVKNGRNDLTVLAPFFVYGKNSEYSEEMQKIYRNFGIEGALAK